MQLIKYGKYLELLRKEHGLSQHDLAEMANCSPSTISRIENGHQMPEQRLFDSINQVFERMGLIYEEIAMENILEFKRAGRELLDAIKFGRREEIERKLEAFYTHMDEEDIEHKQYYLLGKLVRDKKRGMQPEEYLAEAKNIFELHRNLPKYENIPDYKLSKIEYELLRFIGMAHMELEEMEEAERIFKGLLENNIDARSPFIQDRYMLTSTSLANLFMLKNDFESMGRCLSYLYNSFIESANSRVFFKMIMLHEEMCQEKEDFEGAEIINKFMESTQKLMNFIHLEYRVS